MININNKVYDKINQEVLLGDFYIDNIIKIRLETTYPENWLNEMKVGVGTKIDFSNYLSDITFEDYNGWQSMIT